MKKKQTNLARFRPSSSCTTKCSLSLSAAYPAVYSIKHYINIYLNMDNDIHVPLSYLVSMLEHYCVSAGLR
jgi:hypothetical protein